ncbi:MAG: hypothetical protein D6702_06135 [Planctomycetota bacterium]|nr:MAG: hypothetical protein D6702_06135 [Planctomycetota bacterium]
MTAARPPGVEDFPDLLRLRGPDGPCGLFSDCGSWLAVTWGERALLELHDTLDNRVHLLDLGAPARLRTVWADRLEASLASGAETAAAFAGDGLLVIDYRHGRPPAPSCDLPFSVERTGEGSWRIQVGEGLEPPPPDLFARRRRAWNERFARAFASFRGGGARDRLLLARAIATLLWNRRAPRRGLPDAGIIPSPFAYRGFWAWDSWKHAHALARIDPALGLAQLRAQFFGEDEDGMVPDTVMPDPAANNHRNTKPPLAAWALDELRRAGAAAAEVAPLRRRCAGQLRWWSLHRRARGEAFYRYGGVDGGTAAWDSGWDDSARFAGARLDPHGKWRLFALHCPDLHAYLHQEFAAMARLYGAAGLERGAWEERAGRTARLLGRLWDPERGAFCDHDPQGRSTGVLSAACWLPVWSGAAQPRQAESVRRLVLDPRHFGTPVPFPSLAASEPAFDPDGYWNGGVWLDHAAWALAVLGEEGAAARERLLAAVAALPSFYECLSPLTGRPCAGARPAVAQFSWSAAAVVEILTTHPSRR